MPNIIYGIKVDDVVYKYDYENLANLPQVDNTPTASSDNLVKSGGVKTALDAKQDELSFDTTPTAGSTNPVTSDGIKAALDAKQGTLSFDQTPTDGSNNPVTSNGVYDALSQKQNALEFDSVPAIGSINPITSGGVYAGLSFMRYSNDNSNLRATNPQSAIDELANEVDSIRMATNAVKIYGARWNGTTHQMTRLFDAAGITTDTTNFVYSGSVNANYSNPFDSIYPWKDCKQCNVDLAAYAALSAGDDIRDAVVAWYGDPDFATDGSNGFVGRYTPEFWYHAYETEEGRVFCVADGHVSGWEHHKPSIRSIGFAVDDGNDGVEASDGQPLTNIAVSAIHARAKTAGMTLQDIYELDAQTMLAIVEFASYDAQRVMGNGCASGYYKCTVTVPSESAGTGKTQVLLPKAAKAYCIAGATLDFATSQDGVVIANRRTVVSVADYDSTYCLVAFTPGLDLDASLYASIHGRCSDDSFGNKSGYIGTDGKNNAWYRGAIMWGNRNQYTLGIARKTGTSHVWLCPEEDCDDYDGLDETAFFDTGIVVPIVESNAWKSIGNMKYPNGIMAVGVIDEFASIVGDSQYCVTAATGNTSPFFGGIAHYGATCGFCYANWTTNPGNSSWYSAGVLLLKTP